MPAHAQEIDGNISNYLEITQFKPRIEQNIEVLEHWKVLRGEAPVPPWSGFDPLDIPDHLANCVIVEYLDDATLHVRLYGTRLADRGGIDLTGTNLCDFFEPEQQAAFITRIKILRTRPAALRSFLESPIYHGGIAGIESMQLPFCNEAGRITHGIISIYEIYQDNSSVQLNIDSMNNQNIRQNDVIVI